ncbi:MAG: HAD-IA family hydrolase [Ignavibacteria bacterium]|nr:HAD-IA family hydrolase [Ignavibacteria bacterium]
MIKNIIFDIGNTLVYFDHNIFFDGVARIEKTFNVNSFRDYIKSNKLGQKLASSKITHRKVYNLLKKEFDIKTSYSDFIHIHNDIFWENTNMKDFLSKISNDKRFELFMLSNTDSEHMKFLNKNFSYINVIKRRVLSFEVKMLKPDRRIFQYTIKKYKLLPKETLFIDDLKENVLSADNLGINTFHYTTHDSFLKQFNNIIPQ